MARFRGVRPRQDVGVAEQDLVQADVLGVGVEEPQFDQLLELFPMHDTQLMLGQQIDDLLLVRREIMVI